MLSPADRDNFVDEQDGDSSERDAGGQQIASEEIEDYARPARASRDQSPADIERSHCSREVRGPGHA
jgi:hypothetical protein